MIIRLIKEPISAVHHDGGFSYRAVTGRLELSGHEKPSLAKVLENGVPLPGAADAVHDEIRQLGRGRYSFWYEVVYFASSDNSDPCTNGRRYEIAYPPEWQRPIREWIREAGSRLASVRQVDYWYKFYRFCFWYVWRRGMVMNRLRRRNANKG